MPPTTMRTVPNRPGISNVSPGRGSAPRRGRGRSSLRPRANAVRRRPRLGTPRSAVGRRRSTRSAGLRCPESRSRPSSTGRPWPRREASRAAPGRRGRPWRRSRRCCSASSVADVHAPRRVARVIAAAPWPIPPNTPLNTNAIPTADPTAVTTTDVRRPSTDEVRHRDPCGATLRRAGAARYRAPGTA